MSFYTQLKNLLNTYRVKKDDHESPYTHTGLGPFAGKYNIPTDKRDELHNLIVHSVFNEKRPVHLTEKRPDMKPIIIDLDFKYPIDYSSRQHTTQHIEAFLKLYNSVIRKFTTLSKDEPLRAYVFERLSGPYPFKGNFKDGVHIMYPNVHTHVNIQHLLRQEVMKQAMSMAFTNSEIGVLPLKNKVEDIVDSGVIDKVNWQVYGSSKPDRERYDITHVYDQLYDDHVGDYVLREFKNFQPDHFDLINLLSTHRKAEPREIVDINEDHKPTLTQYIENLNSGLKIKKNTFKNSMFMNSRSKKRKNKIISAEEARQTIEEAKKLVGILAQFRADSYQHWISVGFCLFNISPSLLDTWIEFSKKSPKFQEGECEEMWSKFTDRDLGMGSLHRWAKLDNEEAYREIRAEFIGSYIFKSLSNTTQDVAEVIYQMYKHQYACVSAKGDMWYEFKNHRWHECKNGITLKDKIGKDVLNEYLKLIVHYNSGAIESNDLKVKEHSLLQASGLTEMTYKLRDIQFKEKIMKECVLRFYSPEFMKQLDTNPYLLGFENGVYDLKESIFRDGCPEDHVSLTTGIDFPDVELDLDDPIVQEILEFFSQVFPDEELREYALLLFSSFLQGTNPEEKFHVFTGSGGNGKSKLIELFEMTIGDYGFKFPITLLTQKRAASGAANPEVARTRGKRFGVFQEPDEGERLNVGLMKELTGGDKIMTRELYGAPFEFKPQFKLVLCCNHKPKIPSDDDGTWRRMSVLEFLSRFVRSPDATNRYEFPRDDHLTQKLDRWKEMFMVILVEYYKKYKEMPNGLEEPQMVKDATGEYQKDSDTYAQFRDEYFEKDEYGVVKLEESYARFKNWYSDAIGGKAPNRRDFKQNMEKKFKVRYVTGGGARQTGWHGWRMRSIEDEMGVDTAAGIDKQIEQEMPLATPTRLKVQITPKTLIAKKSNH